MSTLEKYSIFWVKIELIALETTEFLVSIFRKQNKMQRRNLSAFIIGLGSTLIEKETNFKMVDFFTSLFPIRVVIFFVLYRSYMHGKIGQKKT